MNGTILQFYNNFKIILFLNVFAYRLFFSQIKAITNKAIVILQVKVLKKYVT